MQANVLVLNQGFMPIGKIPWQRAISLIFTERAEVIEHSDKEVRTVNKSFKLPSVIRVLKWVKAKLLGVRFNRNNVYIRDGGLCQYCGVFVPKNKMTLDHVIPKSRGGKTNFENTVLCCKYCNSKKDCQTPEEAGLQLLRKPIKPSKYLLLHATINNNREEITWKPYLRDE